MLTADEIKNIVSRGEGHHADFKRSVPTKVRELAEEACAFVNSDGGLILVGVNDENQIIGTLINNKKRSDIQDAIRVVSPAIHAKIYSVDVDEKQVWVIDVPVGKDKPHTVSGAIFIREGANTQKLTGADEIRKFYQKSNSIFFDAMPCSRFNIDTDFDNKTFDLFLRESGVLGDIPQQQILENLHVFDESGVIKNGGVLFFGEHPEKFFPQAVVHCVRFKGAERIHIIDDKMFEGTLYEQYIQADKWIKDKLEVEYIIKGSGKRKEIWEIPLEVFKEAIINALSHRDYYQHGAVTMIEVYDDRVEISNPGGLLEEVKKEFGKKSASRNPLVFGLFTRMDLVEKVASGIPRMRKEMKKAGLPEPTFYADGGFFTATFMRPEKKNDPVNTIDNTADSNDGIVNDIVNDIVNKKGSVEQVVYELIKEGEGLSASDIAKVIGKSWRTTMRYLDVLKREGKIEFRGAPKTGGYYLKS